MVKGEGPIPCSIMFVGEAPGSEEAHLMRPFVGPAGQIFNRLLGDVGLTREEVFITNRVKCRPYTIHEGEHRTYQKNRKPSDEELANCSVLLQEEIEKVQPRVIGAMGNYALSFWKPDARISCMHGDPFKFKSLTVVPLFHPATVIYDSKMYDILKADMMVVRKCMI
jgi:DNA polymerase